jgi:hypothetical protein
MRIIWSAIVLAVICVSAKAAQSPFAIYDRDPASDALRCALEFLEAPSQRSELLRRRSYSFVGYAWTQRSDAA